MLYQLPTGRTVEISFEEFLDLSDEKIQELIAANAGIEIDDPFINLKARKPRPDYSELPELEDIVEPLPEEIVDEIKKLNKDGTS